MQGNNENPIDITIHLSEVSLQGLKGNTFLFLPPVNKEVRPAFALFSHGYTSHKGSILNWGSRLAEMGIPTALFDLPGHYLGSFHEVSKFEVFQNHAHELFGEAFKKLLAKFAESFPLEEHLVESQNFNLILGGHSLGALLSLKALNLLEFGHMNKLAIGVGLAMANMEGDKIHLFETEFYQKTLNIRAQLVSPELHPSKVFPWIKKEKEKLVLHGQKIHLMTGEDDVVAVQSKMEELADRLRAQGNEVTTQVPKRLSHHQPELAASPIVKYLKDLGIVS